MPFINRCGGGGSAKLQSKTATPSTSQVVVTPDSDYDGLDKCTVSAIKLQSKSVSPSTSYKEVYPDSSYDGLSKVTVNGIELTSKTVTPSKEQQTVLPGAGYDGLGSVTVNAAPTETKKITSNGIYTPTGDNVGFESVEVAIPDTKPKHSVIQSSTTTSDLQFTIDSQNCSGWNFGGTRSPAAIFLQMPNSALGGDTSLAMGIQSISIEIVDSGVTGVIVYGFETTSDGPLVTAITAAGKVSCSVNNSNITINIISGSVNTGRVYFHATTQYHGVVIG